MSTAGNPATGVDPSEGWSDAFRSVPRRAFIPQTIWRYVDEGLVCVTREEDPAAWLARTDADEAIVTQVDDGRTPAGKVGHYVSSSASQPSIVALMLEHLAISGTERVLEIGTGTGWNAGLLASRLGDDRVTSVEIDDDVANRAREALAAAGLNPTVVTGDGGSGYPPHAPYDRIISTAAVRHVPQAWVQQTRPGGLVLTPWGNAYDNGALACLTVAGDGSASGPFVADVGFMWLRSHRTPHGSVEDRIHHESEATHTTTTLHPHHVSETNGSFAVGLLVPDCHAIVVFDDDNRANPYTVWFMHPASRSWASLRVEPGYDEYPVRQLGPRRLWDEIEAAHQWWVDLGRPWRGRFGLTVTEAGQHVWLDEPSHVVASPSV